VPEARSKQTKAPLVVMTGGARQKVPAAGDTKACHQADRAVAAACAVVVAAGADDKIPGTIQSNFKRKK
jgi:hypothetical protein